jgi:hypothetical protein
MELSMSRIVVFENLTLDGVMQAPGRSAEDFRGGLQHGGGATPCADQAMGREAGQSMARSGGLMPGRLTYEDLHAVSSPTAFDLPHYGSSRPGRRLPERRSQPDGRRDLWRGTDSL